MEQSQKHKNNAMVKLATFIVDKRNLFFLLRRLQLSLCRNSPAGVLFLLLAFPQCSRTAAQRPVFRLPVGTRLAGLQKTHKPPTRARRCGNRISPFTFFRKALNLGLTFTLIYGYNISVKVGDSYVF